MKKNISKLFLFELALKNILQYKQRTILTFLVFTFGIMFYILMDGLMSGFEQDTVRLLISLQTGNIKILDKNYNEEEFFKIFPLQNSDLLIDKLKNLKFIKGITKRIKFTCLLEANKNSTPVVVLGINFNEDNNVFDFIKFINKNENIEKNPLYKNISKIYIGKNIIEELELKEGDPIILSTKTNEGMFNSQEFILAGNINCPDISINTNFVVIEYSEAQQLLGINSPTEITLKTDNFKNDKKFLKIIKKTSPEYFITYWAEEGRDILELTKTKSKFTNIFIFFIIIIAIIGIINTMTISLYQKITEIGTLKAIGFTEKEINFLFTLESLLIAFTGTITGILLGLILNYFPYKYGMDLSKMMDVNTLGSFNTQSIIYSAYNLKNIFTSLFLGLFFSYISTRSIVKRASKLDPAVALRKIL